MAKFLKNPEELRASPSAIPRLAEVSLGWVGRSREGGTESGRTQDLWWDRAFPRISSRLFRREGGEAPCCARGREIFPFPFASSKSRRWQEEGREGKRAKLIKKSRQDPSLPALSFSLPHQERKMGGWALQDQNEWEQKTSV